MNKKRLLVGILSLSTLVFVGCNSKENKEENNYEYETEEVDTDDEVEAESEDYTPSYEEPQTEVAEPTKKISSEDIDSMLDSYESYVTEYISYLKKMKNNDMSAMESLPSLMEKGEEWGNKMENAKGEMSAKQIARMTKIIGKINVAMAELR
ncbi:DUF6591 domain-containing protein [Myroides odoratimimus]|uniref:DUF6591 domain-containing protein n=1 Tax=Myroides odoratimimus TaxID=76832 RepID=UPI001CE05E7D|nr:DUF6591 domain-containing protein [Myroides odoratimimus]MCA4806402.1 hypothetical protein [Myroides odoratimimus]MDM1083688.1 hypothetical protein [Myroides odoratimimus]